MPRTRPRARLATALACVLLTGCGGDDPAPTVPPGTPLAPSGGTPSGTTASAPPGTPPPTGTPDLAAPQTVATGLEVPWGLAFLPDGAALVAERNSGRVLRVRPDQQPEEVFRVPGVAASGEGGLLGLAVSPDYRQDGFVYAYFTGTADNRIVRFRLDGGTPEILFTGIAKAGNHNGGRLAFGPDRLLYVGTGDAGRAATAQDMASPNGKILRLTKEGRPAPGNPVGDSPVYSLGHRNVQGLAWDARGRLLATEFGQNRLDEVNVIEAGGNYGWPEVEGSGGAPRFIDPLLTWSTSEASPSGAAVIGDTLYVAALRGARLWAVPLAGGAARAELSREYGRLRTVQVAPDGTLWLSTSNRDGRGRPEDGDDRLLRFPVR